MTLSRPKDQKDLEDIFRAGLAAVDAETAVKRNLKLTSSGLQIGSKTIAVSGFRKIWILGAGKASAAMARAAEEFFLQTLPDQFAGGLVVTKVGHGFPIKKIRILEASHPVPDGKSQEAALALVALLNQMHPQDLILFLLSGGASSLVCLPPEGISLADKRLLNEILLQSGANIHEINTLRKHCSIIKGGNYAQHVNGRKLVTLAISDVPKDDPTSIGSGMTVGDPTTLTDCHEILRKYGIISRIPLGIVRHLQRVESETPKPGDPCLAGTSFQIIARNQDAVAAARKKAQSLGYVVLSKDIFFHEDVHQVSLRLRELIQEGQGKPSGPFAIVTGGEPTVVVKGQGQGGRNTELALQMAVLLDQHTRKGVSFLSSGTDGTDGPTDAAGAFADETSLSRAKTLGLDAKDFLARNDAYTFFEQLGDLLKTGPTGTNVMDLQILIA